MPSAVAGISTIAVSGSSPSSAASRTLAVIRSMDRERLHGFFDPVTR